MPTFPYQIAGLSPANFTVWANNFGVNGGAGATSNGTLLVFPLCPANGVFPGVMTANKMLIGMVGNVAPF